MTKPYSFIVSTLFDTGILLGRPPNIPNIPLPSTSTSHLDLRAVNVSIMDNSAAANENSTIGSRTVKSGI
jgi:hypothetical protein